MNPAGQRTAQPQTQHPALSQAGCQALSGQPLPAQADPLLCLPALTYEDSTVVPQKSRGKVTVRMRPLREVQLILHAQ